MTRRSSRFTASLVLLAIALSSAPAWALEEPERLRLVGERAFDDGLYAVSRRALERLVTEYPNDPKLDTALLLLGRARLALGDAESALEALRRLDALKAPNPPIEGKFWEGEALFRLRRFAEARAAYEDVVREDVAFPNAPDAFYGIGLCALELRHPEGAVTAFRKVLSGWPQYSQAPNAAFYLARSLVELKRYDEALPLLTAFPTRYPDHKLGPDTLYLLGVTRVSSGDTKAGVGNLKAFVAAAPRHAQAPAARRLIAQTLARSTDRGDLQEAYTRLMAQEPPTAEALYDAGAVAGRLGHSKDQATAWRRLRKEFPKDALAARAALGLANAAFKRKDWKEASAEAHAASRSGEAGLRAEALLLHGESELKLSRYGTAAKSFESVGAIKSADAGTRYRALAGLGLAREHLKETRAAITAYEQVAAKSPDSTLRSWARQRAAALRERLPKPKTSVPKAHESKSSESRDGGS